MTDPALVQQQPQQHPHQPSPVQQAPAGAGHDPPIVFPAPAAVAAAPVPSPSSAASVLINENRETSTCPRCAWLDIVIGLMCAGATATLAWFRLHREETWMTIGISETVAIILCACFLYVTMLIILSGSIAFINPSSRFISALVTIRLQLQLLYLVFGLMIVFVLLAQADMKQVVCAAFFFFFLLSYMYVFINFCLLLQWNIRTTEEADAELARTLATWNENQVMIHGDGDGMTLNEIMSVTTLIFYQPKIEPKEMGKEMQQRISTSISNNQLDSGSLPTAASSTRVSTSSSASAPSDHGMEIVEIPIPIDEPIPSPVSSIDDTSSTSDADALCLICLSSYHAGDPLSVLPCLHRFHSACIINWLQRHGHCPCCRRQCYMERTMTPSNQSASI